MSPGSEVPKADRAIVIRRLSMETVEHRRLIPMFVAQRRLTNTAAVRSRATVGVRQTLLLATNLTFPRRLSTGNSN